MKSFYKNSDNSWIVNGEVQNRMGDWKLGYHTDNTYAKVTNNGAIIINNPITEIEKDSSGNKYDSYNEFNSSVLDFFVKVLGGPSNAQKNSDITKAEIEEKLTGVITSHTHSYLSDSPQDGKIYGRKDSSWTEISSGSGADVYDWSWLDDIDDTVTQQQYDELLAAVQTGKIFPQVAIVQLHYREESEEPLIEIRIIKSQPPNYIYFIYWYVLPDLNVMVQESPNLFVTDTERETWNDKIDASKFQVVAELPTFPVTGVFYFVKE